MTTPISLTLIGGPTVLIEIGSLRLLTDPTFDQPRTYKLPHAELRKLTGPAIPAADIGAIDAVLLSHDQHFDNLDESGRAFLSRVPTVLTTTAGATRLGAARGLAPWQTVTLGANAETLHITAAPARHGPAGIEPLSGDVIGFLIGTDTPGDAIYITGDTVWFEGTAEVARRYQPQLVIVFAGAARTRGAMALTMNVNDVIETAAAFPHAHIAIAHAEGWAHFSETREQIEAAFATLGLTDRLLRLVPGVAAAATI